MSSLGKEESKSIEASSEKSSEGLLNCWEARNCGREPGGMKAVKDGVCPAAEAVWLDGVNRGINGGRVCWVVAGTMGSKVCNLTFSEKITDCIMCDFYQKVLLEEPYFEIYPVEKMK
ncbi:MAG: two-CW domain-containing protein [Candidatus Thorarchaeota archaeon]